MNLARHAGVLWRFRVVTAGGIVIGIMLALMASYSVSFDGGLKITARGQETWTSASSVFVTQRGFPAGRSVLPSEVPAARSGRPSQGQLSFADPGRFNQLADLYSTFALSDLVRNRIPGRPTKAQISFVPVAGRAGSPTLPVLNVTASASTPAGARLLNVQAIAALRGFIEEESIKARIPENNRVIVQTLDEPSMATLAQGRTLTASIIVLMLALVGTIAVTHLLAAVRDRRPPQTEDEPLVLPWSGPPPTEAKKPPTDANDCLAVPEAAGPARAPRER